VAWQPEVAKLEEGNCRVCGRPSGDRCETLGGAAGIQPRLPREVDGSLHQHRVREIGVGRQRAKQLGHLGCSDQRSGDERAQLLDPAPGGRDRFDQLGRAELPGLHKCLNSPLQLS
jgi:hypothetical protein